ncbi:hypothetical protein SEA_SEMPERFI_46 [Mycobacterium phage SemperFi]|uniref:Uncharacterized protein n=2 Tax=Turbidovirus TaxID=2948936 RepID=A0A7D5FLY2_9CAUD|nr:hypothetical protein KIY79_gp46 [Mycobacterium phage Anselm]YP_010063852.1 hypothetical protein KIY84_gp45 [Mycobacterium phage Georgie2]AIS73807.1 hypothetical protein PBI_POWER_44 [Mycobacterium phage Power]ATN88399.1 hypothetical protein SEA_DALMATIAN_46 [Mycobacterium phage Dalmatian]ATN91890.1 hypothetical protein SEA_SNAPTAP_45 [Mycobacterium phage SnapTap]AXC33259.1 hypothetical protein SEA_CRUCIO_45 [Mycobacterium phage Crucio]AXQ52971.1 hypothetical protein SEA_QUEENBEESLY_45 [Myc
MQIKNVERYEIPFTTREASLDWNGGTTVGELIEALLRIPKEAVVATDYGRGHGLLAMHYKPDIEVN